VFGWVLTLPLLFDTAPLSAGLPETIERVKPSIVAVGTYQKTRSPAFSYRGTGFVVGDGTLIATNAHVVPQTLQVDSGESIVVLTVVPNSRNPRPLEAKPVATDKDHDLALLRITGVTLPALSLGDSVAVREGQSVAFTGFPIGHVLGFVPVTHRGIVAALPPIALPAATARQLDEKVLRRLQSGAFTVFQLDATAYPGNSGSPVFDPDSGVVVGIINMVFVKGTKESALSQPTGISFAVPTQFLQELMRSMR
jgi:S1-C subfamily serine protease